MKMRLISGNSNTALAEEIAKHLGISLTKRVMKRFSDGESYVRISESIRGDDVFIIQSICNPVNHNIMELLILIDTLKRASAARITAVIPYYGYARQDRKSEAREPITAKLVADLLTKAGADRVLAVDLHVSQIQGFFDIPVDEVSAVPLFARYLLNKKLRDLVVVATDAGAAKKARSLAKKLNNCPIAIIDKRRTEHNESAVMHIVGDIKGKTAVLIDDMIDTGNSVVNAVNKLSEQAKEVYVCATHPVFSGECVEKLESCNAAEIIITNTIPTASSGKIKVINMAKLLSDIIFNIHNNKSVSSLFV